MFYSLKKYDLIIIKIIIYNQDYIFYFLQMKE